MDVLATQLAPVRMVATRSATRDNGVAILIDYFKSLPLCSRIAQGGDSGKCVRAAQR